MSQYPTPPHVPSGLVGVIMAPVDSVNNISPQFLSNYENVQNSNNDSDIINQIFMESNDYDQKKELIYNDNAFLKISFKIQNFIKDHSDCDVFKKALDIVNKQVPTQIQSVAGDIKDDNKDEITNSIINNIDNVDFNKVIYYIVNILKNNIEEVETLKNTYEKQIKSINKLDLYKSDILYDLTVQNEDKNNEFIKTIENYIDEVINSKKLEQCEEEYINRVVDLFKNIERFKFLKKIDEFHGICGLCYDRVVNITYIPCGHTSCQKCFSLFNLTQNCPMCREKISCHNKLFL